MKRSNPSGKFEKGPRVYSYLRFSTSEQKLGDSARRQIEKAKSFAEKQGYVFDEELRDEGLSAFSGANKTKGALARFLQRVREGRISKGSVLFVEDVDRISREGIVDALQTIVFDLIASGISIRTPDAHYTKESLNGPEIWHLLARVQLATTESQKKSERVRAAWAEKKRRARANREPLTRRCPSWLRIEGGRYTAIPEAKRTIQMIFRDVHVLGQSGLVKKLNAQAPWCPPTRRDAKTASGWRKSFIRKILTNRAVLGEYQPFTTSVSGERTPEGSPVKDYYPAIVTQVEFDSCQARLRERRKRSKGGRTGSAQNVFSYLARCGYCGGPMYFRDRGKGPKGGRYLVCERKERGIQCHAAGVRYEEVEATILTNCAEIKPALVLPSPVEAERRCEELKLKIAASSEQLQKAESDLRGLMEQSKVSGLSQKSRQRLSEEMKRLEQESEAIKRAQESDRISLASLERDQQSLEAWKVSLAKLRTHIRKKSAVEERLRLREHLSEFIGRIEIYGRGFEKAVGPDTEALHNLSKLEGYARYLEDLFDEQGWPLERAARSRFLRYVLSRRMSREGRFYRVVFRPEGQVDLVPGESIASGWRLINAADNQWKMSRPDWTRLLKDFLALNGKKDSKGEVNPARRKR